MNSNLSNEPSFSAGADKAKDAATALADRAKEAAGHLADKAKEAGNSLADGARRTGQAAQETYDSACANFDDTMERTRSYVRQNPVPAVLGAFALGAVLSFVLAGHRRHEPTFRERYVSDPLESLRDTIFAALAPVGKQLHDRYDSARDSAGDALDHAQENASRHAKSWSKQLRHAGHNLKFW